MHANKDLQWFCAFCEVFIDFAQFSAVEIEVIMTTYVIITERNNRDSKMDQKTRFHRRPCKDFQQTKAEGDKRS
ncbi:hypothetical protein DW099_09655 [Emergencia timonensis]|uniref:Uncharacterized protein n=1 Tax=Emergencia timonensis TaxID=1776384 RepID=A0A415E4S0_9FIRM|nr:hypothetical protein DW099_09655 [Emergencia timonensis]